MWYVTHVQRFICKDGSSERLIVKGCSDRRLAFDRVAGTGCEGFIFLLLHISLHISLTQAMSMIEMYLQLCLDRVRGVTTCHLSVG